MKKKILSMPVHHYAYEVLEGRAVLLDFLLNYVLRMYKCGYINTELAK